MLNEMHCSICHSDWDVVMLLRVGEGSSSGERAVNEVGHGARVDEDVGEVAIDPAPEGDQFPLALAGCVGSVG
jgi:hypothetical protein